MYDSHGRIVYDYGDTPGMQRPVSGNSNALGSQSLDDRKNGKIISAETCLPKFPF